jgi:SAM-dependent MidA family methyltransferase
MMAGARLDLPGLSIGRRQATLWVDMPPTDHLADRLHTRIAERGPIPFAEFMEAALYDPVEGFYVNGSPIGAEGAFVTSPHLSPAFGQLVARQVDELWELLDRPRPFHVIEVGAGDGTLGRQLLHGVDPQVGGAIEYLAVERGAGPLAAARAAGLATVERLADVPSGLVGCVLANEWLDNEPFHRLRGTEDGVVELFVGSNPEGNGFALVEGPPSPAIMGSVPPLPPGSEAIVRPSIEPALREIARILARGYTWIVDYATAVSADDPTDPSVPSVHGYRGHRQIEDVLVDPGSSDITAGVDFEDLGRRARALGMTTWGPVTQRDALLSLGFEEIERRGLAAQAAALDERRGIEALRHHSDRHRAGALIARGGLGDFLVLGMGTGVAADRVPRSFRRNGD